MDTATLLDKLSNQAKAQGVKNDRGLAKVLGVEQSGITHYRIGRCKPGVLFLHRVIKAFPELKPVVAEYVETYQE